MKPLTAWAGSSCGLPNQHGIPEIATLLNEAMLLCAATDTSGTTGTSNTDGTSNTTDTTENDNGPN
jgi:hypothetical protein